MPQVYDNRNERVKITIDPEDNLVVFIENSADGGGATTMIIALPTAEDLLEGLTRAVDLLKMKRKSNDGY